MEQLQSVTTSGAAGSASFTAPQWQDDSIMLHHQPRRRLTASCCANLQQDDNYRAARGYMQFPSEFTVSWVTYRFASNVN
jgi:hypothetical protein